MYTAEVESFTHKNKNQVIVSKKVLSADDKLLIVDDFLANGCALQGLISIAEDAGATTGFLIGTCALLIIKNEYIGRTLGINKTDTQGNDTN